MSNTQEVKDSSLPARFNFAQTLLHANLQRAEKMAYLDDTKRLSYGALDLAVRRMASGLQALGLRREERVFIFMHDNCDWPVSFLGAIYAGMVPVAINTLLPASDVAYMLSHSRAQAAIASEALLPVLRDAMQIAALDSEVKHLIVSNPKQVPLITEIKNTSTLDLDTWLLSQEPLTQPAQTGPDDMAFWLYSSGSTGRPKGTVHSHANPYHTARLYGQAVLGLRESDICFSAAKLFFAYGLGNALTFPLSVGATTLLMAERPTPDAVFKRWLGDIHQTKPTIFFGAPTGFAGMLASGNLPERSQLALRMCSSAGEALPRELGERFKAYAGCDIVDGIGSTEMLHVYLSNSPDDVRYGTTGKAVAGYDLSLRDDAGHEVNDGEVGDLYIKGPTAALLYWGRRDKSLETFQGAWTKSGDKYVRDSEGYYTYAGRSDDMFKVSGQYVSPFEVESALMQHPAVLEAAVVAIADAQGLTRVKAYVALKTGQAASDTLNAELQAFVKTKLTPHKYPRQIEFIAELPKTATGKIQRFKLRSN